MSEYDKMSKLIDDVNKILITERAERYRQGKEFNIFSIQRTNTDEVRVCRLLRELLDPKGSHGQGDVFLRLFINMVLKMDENAFSDSDYSLARVSREELTDSSRRIDLVIEIGQRFIPIEVKLYAEDQDAQCFDYYEYAKKRDKNTVLYYLTLDAHEPTDDSKKNLDEGQYKRLSFFTDIHNWIDSCIYHPKIEQIYSIREILIQFRTAIEELNGIERSITMEIKEKISASEDTFAAANMIANSLPAVKADMMCRIFEDLERYVKNKGASDCVEYYKEESYTYYKSGKYTWPSLNFAVQITDENIKEKVVFRIEIEQHIYCGIAPWYGTNNWDGKKSDELNTYVSNYLNPIQSKHKSSNWYWWEYLNNEIDFKYCNDAYIALFDKEKYDKAIKQMYSKIDELLVPLM